MEEYSDRWYYPECKQSVGMYGVYAMWANIWKFVRISAIQGNILEYVIIVAYGRVRSE